MKKRRRSHRGGSHRRGNIAWSGWAWALGIFILAIPVGTAALVRSSQSQTRLRSLLSQAIRGELGLSARLGSVQLELFPLAVVGRRIALSDPVYGRFVSAEELRIQPSFRGLLRGELDLHRVEIRRARLRLVVRQGQVRNLPQTDEGGGELGEVRLPFHELYVVDSRVRVDGGAWGRAEFSGLNANVRNLRGGVEASATVRRGFVRHARGTEPLLGAEVQARLQDDVLHIRTFDVRTSSLRLLVRDGRASLRSPERGLAARVDLDLDLARLAHLPFPPSISIPPLVGALELRARVGARDDKPEARGTLAVRGGRIEQFGFGSSTVVSFIANEEAVQFLEGSEYRNPKQGGRATLTGRLSLREPGLPLELRLGFHELSFARLMDNLGVTEHAIVEWFFNGAAQLRGTLMPLDLSGPIRTPTHGFQVSRNAYHAEDPGRVIGVRQGEFRGRVSIREDAIRFERVTATLPRSRLRGDVHLGFDDRLEVNAIAEPADLRDITPLDRWPVSGVGQAEVRVRGTFHAPRVTGHVGFADFAFNHWHFGDIDSDAWLDPDGLGVHFPRVEAALRNSRYRADDLYLNFHDDRFQMTSLLRLSPMALSDFYSVFGVQADERYSGYQGLLRGRAALGYTNGFPGDLPSGTLDVEMDVGVERASVDGYGFDGGALQGRFVWRDWDRGAEGARLTLSHASLRKGRGTLTLRGEMALGGRLAFTATADRIALRDIEGIGDRGLPVNGLLSAVGRVGGTVGAMRAQMDVGLTQVRVGGRTLGRGRTPGSGRFFVKLTDQSDPWVAKALDWRADALPAVPCARARHGLATGRWAPDPPLSTVSGPQPRLLRPMAFLVCGQGLGGRLRVDMAVGRTERLPLRGRVAVSDFDLGTLLWPEQVAAGSGGRLSGAVSLVDGAAKVPGTLRGALRLDEVRLLHAGIPLQSDGAVDIDVRRGRLRVRRARFTGPDARLSVTGGASFDRGLALEVAADLGLGALARFSDRVAEAEGRVGAQVRITGPFAEPELYGTARVSAERVRFAALPQVLERLRGSVRFSQRSLLFEGFSAAVAGGRVSMTGQAELDRRGVERFRYDIYARGLEYAFADEVDSAFGGDVRLGWRRGQRLPTLSGVLRISRLDYRRPIALRSLGDVAATAVHGAFRHTRTQVDRYNPDDDGVRLDLSVSQTSPFRLHNNLIDAEMVLNTDEAPFRLVGTDQRFGVLGRMEVRRGRVFFQNNDFEVRRGVIHFEEETRIDPHIDLEAITQIRRASDLSAPSWRISLLASGRPDSLRLMTRSEPDLPQPDILMLLAFGMTRGELQQAQGGGAAFASSAALEALTAVTGVDRELRRALPVIDDFRLTTGYSARTGRSEPRLSIGKRLSEQVRLSATTGLSEAREFRASAEWQLDDRNRLEVSYDNYNVNGTNSLGNLGLDWGFRLEFE